MRKRLLRSLVLAALASAGLLAGCSSTDTYSGPTREGRTPVVAPASTGPWWWPF